MKNVAEKGSMDEVIESLMKIVTYMLNVNEMRYLISHQAYLCWRVYHNRCINKCQKYLHRKVLSR